MDENDSLTALQWAACSSLSAFLREALPPKTCRLRKIYHPVGQFMGKDGQPFDVVFCDLLGENQECLPTIEHIESALDARFVRRLGRERSTVSDWEVFR